MSAIPSNFLSRGQLVQKLVPTHGWQKETKERQTTPDWYVAVFIDKGTYEVLLGNHKTRGLRTHHQILKVYTEV